MDISTLYKSMFKNLEYPSAVLNSDMEVIDINNSFKNLFPNKKENELISIKINKLLNLKINKTAQTISFLSENNSISLNGNEQFYSQLNKFKNGEDEFYNLQLLNIDSKNSYKQLVFLSNMSHEIRTPLNSIVGFSELIEFGNLNAKELKEYTSIIKNNGDMLLHLVEDVIDISKMESGKLNVVPSKCPVNAVIKDVFNTFYSIQDLENTSVEFRIKNEKDDNFEIFLDPYRLKQILMNLVSNAFKFTKKGHIELGYYTKKENIFFYVEDTGRGIDKKEQSEIFERFNRGRIKDIDKIKGSGLGLAISQGIAYFLGGELSLESEKNTGSVFTLSLPITKTLKTAEKIIENNIKPDLSNINILIAEDVYENYLFLEKALKATNANIVWKQNGFEALDYFKKYQDETDLILMDIKMPVMDGTQALKEIRKISAEVPVIAQTAFALEYEGEKMKKAGFNDFISKPIKISVLYKSIKDNLKE